MFETARALAERAARSLADQLAERDQRRNSARTYVRTLFEAHSKLKLPDLLKLAETRELMEKLEVSKNMLAEELTAARAELRSASKSKSAQIKVPKKRRRRDANAPSAKAADRVNSQSGFLPLPDARSGRIENGKIEDL